MKTLSELEIRAVKILINRKEAASRQLALYQERCGHPAIKTSSPEDLVMKFEGCCPDCGKTILPKIIIRMLRGQYSKKE